MIKNNNVWKSKVTVATAEYYLWWRLLPSRPDINKPFPVKEATTDGATPLNCVRVLSDLAAVSKYSDWYVENAMGEHEKVHGKDWESTLSPAFAVAKTTIEALTVPHSCGMTADDARTKIKELPAFTSARNLALGTAANIYSAKYNDRTPATNAAEFSIVHPLRNSIFKKATEEKDENVIWPSGCKISEAISR